MVSMAVPWFICLFEGRKTVHIEKLRDRRSLALNGQNLIIIHNNQPAIKDSSSMGVEEVERVGGLVLVHGNVIPLFGATIGTTKKR